ncbi:MAG: YutD-like domain-containing protein [Candidatus Izemoplasmatales bacterium]
MIDTIHGDFEMIKDYRDAFILDDFNKRYTDAFDIYPYIVGDYSAGILRLKGFTKNGKTNSYKFIPDYLVESCPMNCAYFILKNPHFDPNKKRDE